MRERLFAVGFTFVMMYVVARAWVGIAEAFR